VSSGFRECLTVRVIVDVAPSGSHTNETHRCCRAYAHSAAHECGYCDYVWSNPDFSQGRVSGPIQAQRAASDP